MKVLITGGRGYIGKHLQYYLESLGHKITIYDIKDGYDLKQYYILYDVFKLNRGFDAVVHLGALISVPESESQPIEYYDTNTSTMLNILKVMNKFNTKNLIFASTAAVYDFDTSIKLLTEESNIKPHSIYGHSKFLAEQLLERIGPKFNINYVIFRFFNVAGTNKHVDYKDPNYHLIPTIINKYMSGEKISIFGDDYETQDGTCVRDYIHVDDICSAIYLALNKFIDCDQRDIINLGTGSGYSVKEVIDSFNLILKDQNKIPIESVIRDRRPGDPGLLVTNNDKAYQKLGWVPKHDLNSILKSSFFV